MSAWRSTPGSAQKRCARRALVNSLDGSGWDICRGRDAAWGAWHHPSMPRCLGTGAQ